MKVLIITDKLFNGGGERVLQKILEASHGHASKVDIFYIGRNNKIDFPTLRRLEKDGARILRLPGGIVNLRNYDTYHFYNLTVFTLFIPLIVALRLRSRSLVHVHGNYSSANKIIRKIYKYTRSLVSTRLYVSNASRNSYSDQLGEVIYNPVDFEASRSLEDDNRDVIKMVSINRLTKSKDVFRQLALVKNYNRDAEKKIQLDIFGSGDMAKKISDYIEDQELENCVKLKGAVPNEILRAELQGYHYFISTSTAEGLGIALIEALYSNLQSVVTPIEAYKEISSLTQGVFFLSENSDMVSDIATLRDIIRKPAPEISFDTLNKCFNSENYANRIFDIYRTLR